MTNYYAINLTADSHPNLKFAQNYFALLAFIPILIDQPAFSRLFIHQ